MDQRIMASCRNVCLLVIVLAIPVLIHTFPSIGDFLAKAMLNYYTAKDMLFRSMIYNPNKQSRVHSASNKSNGVQQTTADGPKLLTRKDMEETYVAMAGGPWAGNTALTHAMKKLREAITETERKQAHRCTWENSNSWEKAQQTTMNARKPETMEETKGSDNREAVAAGQDDFLDPLRKMEMARRLLPEGIGGRKLVWHATFRHNVPSSPNRMQNREIVYYTF
ncbi:hypothetical protein KP509_27G041100 [Ceratopteris richardii]|uniref:Uncharacterized protein n=1 Tax=Ceratopteris richardii TaxID=49495 RepID=A0A8T2RHA2_CERRI|nr:hypothetical protein KP509_27G041100 [Ceratopteris richardii]